MNDVMNVRTIKMWAIYMIYQVLLIIVQKLSVGVSYNICLIDILRTWYTYRSIIQHKMKM